MYNGRQISVLTAGALLLVTACRDAGTEPKQSPDFVAASVSDALTGDVSERNPHFFWLTPLRPSPPDDQLGEFEALASPRVEVVCLDSTQPGCDAETPLVVFTRESGLLVEVDHFKGELPIRGLRLSGERTGTTTYRVRVWTDPLPDFGGPFLLGFADFRVVKATDPAKSLPDGITLVQDGRTLPIRFRIDRGAYEHELAVNLAEGSLDPEGEALCQENCSVTIIPTDQETVAALSEGGLDVTAIRFEPGDVASTSVLVIDERVIDGENENCANGVTVYKKYCYRYRITPDLDFAKPVPFGICPREIPLDETSPWRILKVDYDAQGEPIVTQPPETDVSSFLPCVPPGGITLLGKVVRYARNWLAPPVHALAGTSRPWGGTAKDLSDLFWAIDAELEAVSPLTGTAAAGTAVPITVRVISTQLGTGLSAQMVSFAPSAGGAVTSETATDLDGQVTVSWTLAAGANTLLVTAPLARGTLTFTRTAGSTGVGLSAVLMAPTAMAICTDGSSAGGCGATYRATLTNGTSLPIGPAVGAGEYPRVVLQAWVEQPWARRAAGGSVLTGCGVPGTLDPGICELGPHAFVPSNGDAAGTGMIGPVRATAIIQALLQQESGAVETLAEARLPITLTACQSLIAFRSHRDLNGEIYVMDPDGNNPRRMTDSPGLDLNPAWAPGGNLMAFSSNRDGNWDIFTTHESLGATMTPVNLTATPDAAEYAPTWSPDSTRIAFTSFTQIYVMDHDGSNRQNLTNDNSQMDDYPSWSPDNAHIAFSSAVAGVGVPDIYVMRADGSSREQLTNNNATGAWDEMPAWSPDASRIAFLSSRDHPHTPFSSTPALFDLYVMDADGTNVSRLTTGGVYRVAPSWSPDGSRIAFSMAGKIFVIGADGSNLTQLTDGSSTDVETAWLTCGY